MPQPDPAKAVEAVKLLNGLLRFFGKHGKHWTRGKLLDGQGARCLVGAIHQLHWYRGITPDGGVQYLSAAIWPRRRPRYDPLHFMRFNDACENFDALRAVILKAQARAQRDVEEKYPAIAAANAVAAQKEEEAAARKRQLLAELERERMVRHAAGDSRATYILCPRAPEPHPEPQRLAA